MIYYIQSFCQSVIWKFKLDVTATDKRMPVIYIPHVVWRRRKENALDRRRVKMNQKTFLFHGCIFLFVVLISQLRVVWEVSNTNSIWFSVYFHSHPVKISKIKSVCETIKMTYIRTMTMFSANIHFDKQAHLFPQTVSNSFFFQDMFYLIRRSISKDTLNFLLKHLADKAL